MMRRLPAHLFLLFTFLFLVACGPTKDGEKKSGEEDSRKKAEQEKGSEGRGQLADLGIDVDAGVPKGLQVGDKAPSFSGVTDRGTRIELEEKLKEGPLVLFFYRGEWCPVCNRYLKRYSDSLEMVREAGATVVGVTPEPRSKIEKMRKKSASTIPILPDTGYQLMEDYGVKFRVTERYIEMIDDKLSSDITPPDRDSTAFLPVPATYLIDGRGRIAWHHFDPDYHQRASVRSILRALDRTKD